MATFYADAADPYRPARALSVGPTKVPFSITLASPFGTSGDVIRLAKIPKGATLLGMVIDIPDVDTGATACRFNIGDSGSATRFCTGIDPTAAAGIRFSSYDVVLTAAVGATLGSLPRAYTAEDYVALTLTTANVTTLAAANIKGFIEFTMYEDSLG